MGDSSLGNMPAKGKAESTMKTPGISSLSLAETPTAFHVTVLPKTPFLVVPEVSSERREYAPIGWLEPPTVPTNLVRIFNVVPLPTLFEHNALFRGIPVGLLLMQASNFLSYLSLRESSLDSALSLLPFSGFFPGFSRSSPRADILASYDLSLLPI